MMETSKVTTTSTTGVGGSNTTMTGSTTMPVRRNGSNVIGTELTLIEVLPMRFLIMDAPRQGNVHVYLKEMTKHHVTDVVRVCEPTYPTTDLCNAGMHVHEMEYKDGSSPSEKLILSWLQLVEKTFYMPNSSSVISSSSMKTTVISNASKLNDVGTDMNDGNNKISNNTISSSTLPPCIAVHCIAGLGRAPVMIAIALIEFGNMDPIDAVQFIRSRRRGAINNTQINYLQSYKKIYKKKGNGTSTNCNCAIM
jgi:protein tyrosine phosphatase type IVA